MPELCYKCTKDQRGEDVDSDFKGLCVEGQKVKVKCDGCNEIIWIDHNGKRIIKENKNVE